MERWVAVVLSAMVLLACGFALMYTCAPIIHSAQVLLHKAECTISGAVGGTEAKCSPSDMERGLSLLVFGLGVCTASLPLIALTTAAGAAS